MRLAALFSGGKDSCLALFKAKEEGHEVKYLLNINPKNSDSFMFHKPNLKLLKKQAENLGIPLIIQNSKGRKDEELKDLSGLIKKVKDKVDGIVIGGIASNYQGKRIKEIAEKFNLKVYSPLWDYTGEKLWQELLKNKFKVVLIKISCEGLPKEFLGKIITEEIFQKIKKLAEKYKFRVDFEGGEAETAVLFMPYFKKEIKIKGRIRSEGQYRHFLDF